MDVAACLADRRRYERQLERLHERHLVGGGLYERRQDGVPLAALVRNRSRVARLLAGDVAAGRHVLAPGELRTIRVRGKRREVFRCGLVDLIVHGVVAEIVREATAARLSPRVFSYRPGTSWLDPVTEFAGWVRARHRGAADPRTRGTHVLRLDVASYTDSIPIGAGSPLWPMLREQLGDPLHPMVLGVIRAELALPCGGTACRVAGLPMGQPIAPVLANLYLTELDRALTVPGGFSARYGDDVLFAHPEPAAVHEAERIATAVLRVLGCGPTRTSGNCCTSTRPGARRPAAIPRPAPSRWPSWAPGWRRTAPSGWTTPRPGPCCARCAGGPPRRRRHCATGPAEPRRWMRSAGLCAPR